MVNIETKQTFENPNKVTQKELISLSNDIFNEWNINRLPFAEDERFAWLVENKDFNKGFLEVLDKNLPAHKLEKTQTQIS